jgi:hypothetical protein
VLTDAYSTRFAIEYNPAKAVSFILPLHARSPVFPALAACHRATPWTPVMRELPLALPLRLWGIAHSPALYQGVRGSGWDPAPSRERVGDWGGPETVWALLCVAERRAKRPTGEWGYSTRRHMLGPEHPESVSPGRGVVLTDLQSS